MRAEKDIYIDGTMKSSANGQYDRPSLVGFLCVDNEKSVVDLFVVCSIVGMEFQFGILRMCFDSLSQRCCCQQVASVGMFEWRFIYIFSFVKFQFTLFFWNYFSWKQFRPLAFHGTGIMFLTLTLICLFCTLK